MRPIQLTMTAFGPYKGEETIDFTELDNHNLFVISGATGAGKTTVFDGICFALYGQASGEDRTDFRAMRSDFADDSIQTTVELTFGVHNRTYRIMRQIPYYKKGNKSETTGRVEFYEVKSTGEVPIVDRQIVSEINRKAEELIGFTQAQFSQIVMLPQGEFRKFLTSDTDNKETIMRKIFKTDSYRELVEKLKMKKEKMQSKLILEEQAADGFIQQIRSVLPHRDSLIFNVLATEFHNTHQVIDGLNEEISFYTKKISEDRKRYEESGSLHAKIFSDYHEAKNVNERFNELDFKKIQLTKQIGQLPNWTHKEKQLANAERAASIEELEYQYSTLTKEVERKSETVMIARRKLEDAVANNEKAETFYLLEVGKQNERDGLAKTLFRLQSHLPAVSELSTRESELERLAKEIDAMDRKLAKLQQDSLSDKEKLHALQIEEERLEKKLLHFEERSELLVEMKEKCKVLDEFTTKSTTAIMLEEEFFTKKATFGERKTNYDRLEQNWLNNQAAMLAQTLVEGEACPVCGSTSHLVESLIRDETTITRESLDAERKLLTEAESLFRTAEAKYTSSLEDLLTKKNEMDHLRIDVTNEELHDTKSKLEAEVSDLRKDRLTHAEVKQQIKGYMKLVDELQIGEVEVEKKLATLKAAYDKALALIEVTITDIPEDMRKLDVLQQRISDTERKKSEMDKVWKKVQQDREETLQQLTEARSSELYAGNSLAEAVEKEKIAHVKFHDALVKSGFSSIELYKQSKMPEKDRHLLKEQILDFKQQMHSLNEAVTELTKLLETKERKDLVSMEATVIEYKAAYETALSTYNHSVEFEKSAIELKDKIEQSGSQKLKLEKMLNKIIDLYDVIRGQNEMKLSFERYIQIDYLERIIHSANERLKGLSNGQFELMRSDRQESRGKQSGLGIAVYDAYTGQTRDVKTLSGGEKFNASLCLALGMSDVIQSFQGSVSIETMFIDEGFGSLDEESLNKAVDTLIDLQKTGRMIGVISHVEELKAAFPAILEVRKSKEGHSSTAFVLK